MHVNNVVVKVLPQATDSLNIRFLPTVRVTSKAVLIMDDDNIELLYQTWQDNRNRIVGFFPRRFFDNNYNLNGADQWDCPYYHASFWTTR